MADAPDLAEQLNYEGMQLREDGDIAGAERAYLAAAEAAPEWSAPVYNLGLIYKYEGRWRESLEYNQRAVELAPDDKAGCWNLGIAATALGDWKEARRAWAACGIDYPPGEGPHDFNWNHTPIRLEPDGRAEVVWARRIDPARAQIANVPLPSSSYHWDDIILMDGAIEGERIVDGRKYPVFNALQLLVPGGYCTFILEVATDQPEALAALEKIATDLGGAAENWGTFTSILCAECSLGTAHEHPPGSEPAHPHWGLAARAQAHADAIITAWMGNIAGADLIKWYESPGA